MKRIRLKYFCVVLIAMLALVFCDSSAEINIGIKDINLGMSMAEVQYTMAMHNLSQFSMEQLFRQKKPTLNYGMFEMLGVPESEVYFSFTNDKLDEIKYFFRHMNSGTLMRMEQDYNLVQFILIRTIGESSYSSSNGLVCPIKGSLRNSYEELIFNGEELYDEWLLHNNETYVKVELALFRAITSNYNVVLTFNVIASAEIESLLPEVENFITMID